MGSINCVTYMSTVMKIQLVRSSFKANVLNIHLTNFAITRTDLE